MNIHPLFVHFPVALLTLYSALELIRSKPIQDKFNLFYSKALLVIVGTISGYATLQTGDIAAHLLGRTRRTSILAMHELFGQITIAVYSIIMVL